MADCTMGRQASMDLGVKYPWITLRISRCSGRSCWMNWSDEKPLTYSYNSRSAASTCGYGGLGSLLSTSEENNS